jgi:hypothetical protein
MSPLVLITRSITIDCTGTVDHLRSGNGGTAVRVDAPLAVVVLAQSTAMSNVTGLGVDSGRRIVSYQNNQITGNVTDGAPTGVLPRR